MNTQPIEHGFDIKRFGACGDGAADDTAAIQRAIEGARSRVTDAILALQSLDPKLNTLALGGSDPKAVARKVNAWILPDLSFRPFPMGMTAVGEAFAKMRQLVKDGKTFEATMAGYAIMREIEQVREKGTINEVESLIAKGEVGTVLVDGAERAALLGKDGTAWTNYLNEVTDLTPKAWTFRPDSEDLGLQENGSSRAKTGRAGNQLT